MVEVEDVEQQEQNKQLVVQEEEEEQHMKNTNDNNNNNKNVKNDNTNDNNNYSKKQKQKEEEANDYDVHDDVFLEQEEQQEDHPGKQEQGEEEQQVATASPSLGTDSCSATIAGSSASAAGASATASSMPSLVVSISLDHRFLYQNPHTGQVSTTLSLTTRQLCRILCPPAAATTTTTSSSTTRTSILTRDSYILQLEFDHTNHQWSIPKTTTKESSTPWKAVKDIPILRYAIASWYYQDVAVQQAKEDDDTSNDVGGTGCTGNSSSSSSQVIGPVSCRILAGLFDKNGQHHNSSGNDNDNDNTKRNDGLNTITSKTMVYSHENDIISRKGWTSISELPELVMAMESFQQQQHQQQQQHELMPASTSTQKQRGGNNDDKSVDDDNDKSADQHAIEQQNELDAFFSLSGTKETTKQQPPLTEAYNARKEGIPKKNNKNKNNNKRKRDEDDDKNNDNDDDTTLVVPNNNSKKLTTSTEHHQGGRGGCGESMLLLSSSSKSTKSNCTQPNKDEESQHQHQQRSKIKNNSNNVFSSKKTKCWIYVTGLPYDTAMDEIQQVFTKAGIIDLDPATQKPKIKIYYKQKEQQQNDDADDKDNDKDNKNNTLLCKGDASICYARPESVELAITLLDGTYFRYDPKTGLPTPKGISTMTVQRAQFQQKKINTNNDDTNKDEKMTSKKRQRRGIGGGNNGGGVSKKQREVAKLAVLQALDWDDDEINGRLLTGGKKGLRIIVLKHIFDNSNNNNDDNDDIWFTKLEHSVRTECMKYGTVEKITLYTKHPDGIVIVKYSQPGSAYNAIQGWNHKTNWIPPPRLGATNTPQAESKHSHPPVEAIFWDGVTDYSTEYNLNEQQEEQKQQEDKQREEEFGKWLDEQDELPEELRLKTE